MRIIAAVVVAAALAAGCTITGFAAIKDDINYSLFFCPTDECLSIFSMLVNQSSSAKCALYSYDKDLFAAAHTDIITDTKSHGLMHNKFCVLDGKTVITGSFNPVARASNDHNNIVIVTSRQLAGNYLEEFAELKAESKQKETKRKMLQSGNIRLENRFCPEDACATAVMREIKNAKHSISFAAYSFTHPAIATELILQHYRNVSVQGIVDNDNSRHPYSQYRRLQEQGIDVATDNTAALLHHKFFVIDNSTVITGSFNPTKNADTRNDENILILRNKDVARRYMEEFQRLR